MSDKNIPHDVAAQIEAMGEAIAQEIAMVEEVDPTYNRVVEQLLEVSKQIEEENADAGYFFDKDEFTAALPHIVADQLSALRKDKLTAAEWAQRANRWWTFCDAIANLGITCMYNKAALAKEEYETVFRTLKLNTQFDKTFLKPNGIKIEFRWKTGSIKEDFRWLAMPVLVVRDEQGVEHNIAITPSPQGKVWWLDILTGFHASFEWVKETEIEDQDFEEAPYPSLGDYVVH